MLLPGPGELHLWAVDGAHWPRPRRIAIRQGPGSIGRCRANPSGVSCRIGPTSGWCRCRSRRAAGCCQGTCSRIDPRPTPRWWLSVGSSRPAPPGLPTRSDRWSYWTAHTTWPNWCVWPRTAPFHRAPDLYSGRGRPHKHAPPFKLQDEPTHGQADSLGQSGAPAVRDRHRGGVDRTARPGCCSWLTCSAARNSWSSA